MISTAPASLSLSPHLSSWLQTWRRKGAWWWASYLSSSPHSAATFTLGAGLLFLLCRGRWSGQITLRLLPKLQARVCGLCRVRACPRRLRCSSRVKPSISLRRLLTAPPTPHPAPFFPLLPTWKPEAPFPCSRQSPFSKTPPPSARRMGSACPGKGMLPRLPRCQGAPPAVLLTFRASDGKSENSARI